MNTKLVVFICSTYSDLVEERDALLDAVRRMQLQHDAMEFFGARTERPIETCLQEVRNSDIMVVIVGHKYGSLVPGMEISFSEAEYNEGITQRIPIFVYIRDENSPVLPKNIERDPEKQQLLEAWKNKLRERHTVSRFEKSADLAVQVAADLGRYLVEIRTSYDPESINKEVSTILLMLDQISAWLGGVEKFIGVLSDTLTSVVLGSSVPMIYSLEERGNLAKTMSEESNEILGIADSNVLIMADNKESGLELSDLIKEIDALLKFHLLPLDHEILDRSRLGTLSEAFIIEVGEFKLQLEDKVRRAHTLIANIKVH